MRLAVFVDGENLSTNHAAAIRQLAAGMARPILARVYGDVGKIARWGDEPGFHLIHSGAGKNAADLLLCVDAMEHALTGVCDTLVIASSDRDFTHLARRLREKGLRVVGIGESRTNTNFREACSEFHTLAAQVIVKPAAQPVAQAPRKPAAHPQASLQLRVVPAHAPLCTALDGQIRDVIASASQNGCGIAVVALNSEMRSKHQFVISSLPEKNWRNYLSARPHLYALDAKGPSAKVRYLPGGFPTQIKAAPAG